MPHPENAPPPSAPSEDPGEDRFVKRALIGSVVALALLAGVVLLIVIALQPETRGGRLATLLPRKQHAGTLTPGIPATPFEEITRTAGITFRHTRGALGEKLLPETMGSGVAFFDFDNDDDPDLLFVNGTAWPWAPTSPDKPATAALYRNDGGRFTDVTADSGMEVPLQGMGVACGDYNNDGRVDVFLSGVGDQRLFQNLGQGRFADVTEALGLLAPAESWGTGAAFLDYDRDGDLDLFVCRYVRWSREIDRGVDYRLGGIGRAYGPPINFPGTFSTLYRNEAGQRFVDVSAEAGIQVRNSATHQPMAKSLGVAPVDFNNDGWIDLIIANDTVQNFVFSNRWDGTFAEVGAESGLAFDTFGGTRGAMGIDAGRFTDDESLGVSIGNFANEMLALYVTQPETLIFADEAIGQGVGAASRHSLTFGVFFFDYDLDGWLDLLTANGHIEENIQSVQPTQPYRQPPQLFWNARGARGGRGFRSVTAREAGPHLFQPVVGRGSAYADIDGDGDLDVVITQNDGPPLLFRNDQQLGHPWIRFRLIGTKSNRDALGSWIRVRSGPHTQSRQVIPTRGYLSQSELPVTFGLGKFQRIDEVEIHWSSGVRQKILPGALKLGALNTLQEPEH